MWDVFAFFFCDLFFVCVLFFTFWGYTGCCWICINGVFIGIFLFVLFLNIGIEMGYFIVVFGKILVVDIVIG